MFPSDSRAFSPENLALIVEEVFPDIAAQGSDELDDLGHCEECGADLLTEGCPSCQWPSDY